jgi:hypothetical protein
MRTASAKLTTRDGAELFKREVQKERGRQRAASLLVHSNTD